MQRPSSSSIAFTPRTPSRLGSGSRLADLVRGGPRGTVSMPTSPLGGSSSLWDELVTPSSPAADQPQPQPQSQIAQAFFPQAVSTPSLFRLFRTDGRRQPFHVNQPDVWYEPATTTSTESIFPTAPGSSDGFDEDDHVSHRQKRSQVRIACTHCQKACKRCSNTRYVRGVSQFLRIGH